jgi:hypothetical protein
MADEKYVRNLTPRRLTIKGTSGRVLELPPLHSVGPFSQTDLVSYFKLEAGSPLLAHNLVALDTAPVAKQFDWMWPAAFGGGMAFFVGGRIISQERPDWLPYYVVAGLLVIAFGLLAAYAFASRGREVIVRISGQVFSLVVILAIGVGMPAAAIYFFGGGASMLAGGHATDLALLGRGLQLMFVATASLLPALLYFLFDRQQLRTLRRRFEQQIFRLDPTVKNLTEVRAKYGRQMDEAYGLSSAGEGRLIRGTRWPILMATLVISLGWILTLAPVGTSEPSALSQPGQLLDLFRPQASPITFGFLGAYFFGLNTVLRRYVRGDLKPKAYSSITVRIMIVVILAWVLALMAGDRLDRVTLPLVFLVGIVPETGVTLIREWLARRRGMGPLGGPLEERHPLTELEGIDLYDRARLMDEGVTNIEGLAHHDLIDLMLETRIPVPRLVDWVDQAILYLHLPPAGASESQGDRARLRTYGIRTATDLETAHAAAKARAGAEDGEGLLRVLDDPPAGRPPRLRVVLDALVDDEWLPNVRHWRQTTEVVHAVVEATTGAVVAIETLAERVAV